MTLALITLARDHGRDPPKETGIIIPLVREGVLGWFRRLRCSDLVFRVQLWVIRNNVCLILLYILIL